jgi:dolichol-phosphate mannosyltransferase
VGDGIKPVYSIVIPAYNEESVLAESYKRLTAVMSALETPYELIFVNDGSLDTTADILDGMAGRDNCVKALHFSRNFGHQAAISAGMDYAAGEAVVIIDADLQDPPEVIPKMIEAWRAGSEVVYGKRLSRKGETVFKKLTARMFYRVLRKVTNVDIPVDTGDFRLLDRKVVDTMKRISERNRFMRGLVAWVGFSQTPVEYVRDERFAGETKYPFRKMVKFALDGITSFSYMPLRIATTLGAALSALSFAYLIVIVCQALFTNTTIQGWASTVSIILISQGIIMMMLGMIGEYIGRIFDEIKGRPLYIVARSEGFDTNPILKDG